MMNPNLFTRRRALKSMACGFGYLALAGMTAERAFAANLNPLAPKAPHFKPRARRVIFIFMQGGPSHVDTFDHKPLLEKNDGKMMGFDDARALANTGARGTSQRVLKSPWGLFATRSEWALGFGTLSRNGEACGRFVLHPLDAN